MAGKIYVVRCLRGRKNQVRIGYSWQLDRRLISLQHELKRPLEIIGTVPAHLWDERNVHRILMSYSVRKGERGWYWMHADVMFFIQRMLDPGFQFVPGISQSH